VRRAPTLRGVLRACQPEVACELDRHPSTLRVPVFAMTDASVVEPAQAPWRSSLSQRSVVYASMDTESPQQQFAGVKGLGETARRPAFQTPETQQPTEGVLGEPVAFPLADKDLVE